MDNKGIFFGNRKSEVALLHPPYLFRDQGYEVFPLSWSLNHIGSPSFIGKYPVNQNWQQIPIGFCTMKDFIERRSSFKVEIYNLSLFDSGDLKGISKNILSKKDQDYSRLRDLSKIITPHLVTSFLKNTQAMLFGVDIHWVVFSQGAIKILQLIKEFHPQSYTVVGGFTASYFKKELMRKFPCIDFLIEGDGCVPLLELIRQIYGKKDFSKVANLFYRKSKSVKKGLNKPLNDSCYVKQERAYHPFIPLARGCPLECSNCGGSRYASSNISKYNRIKSYSVESIMEKLLFLSSKTDGYEKAFMLHDPFITLGKKKWEIVLGEIKKNRLNVDLSIEFYRPHSKKDILKISKNIPQSVVSISPESFDEGVRYFHKHLYYSNKELLMNLDVMQSLENVSVGLWFMAGLAKDAKSSIDNTLDFIDRYYNKIKNKERFHIEYNEILFLDPGSLAFDFPKKCGYKLLNKTFTEHMESFELPIFKYQINYETLFFNRDQLFEIFLYIHNRMSSIYYENEIISKNLHTRVQLYNRLLLKYSFEYDKAFKDKNSKKRKKMFFKIGNKLRKELEQ